VILLQTRATFGYRQVAGRRWGRKNQHLNVLRQSGVGGMGCDPCWALDSLESAQCEREHRVAADRSGLRYLSDSSEAERCSGVDAWLDLSGYDAGNKIKGRRRHILVDTLGLSLNVPVFH